MNLKKVLFIVISIFATTFLYSEVENHKFEKYDLKVSYNKFSLPGDAVFIRMNISTNDKYLKDSIIKSSGSAKIFKSDNDKKVISSANFYQINSDNKEKKASLKLNKDLFKRTETILVGIPLSSYLKSGEYSIKVVYSAFGSENEVLYLPLVINEKEFIKETIPLDKKNTAIRTNDSEERMRQIEKLNGIFNKKDEEAVYELTSFEAPTKATRRTSFFADRRIFAYSNGEKATSLHYGIDYGIPTGSEVRSCGDGKVVMAEDRITTGFSTVIEHLPGLYSIYYHQSKLLCKEGDFVKKGDLIGLSGATGLATGPHLHWEIRLNMEAVSPDFFLGDFTFDKNEVYR